MTTSTTLFSTDNALTFLGPLFPMQRGDEICKRITKIKDAKKLAGRVRHAKSKHVTISIWFTPEQQKTVASKLGELSMLAARRVFLAEAIRSAF
jgi:hypothetical protein